MYFTPGERKTILTPVVTSSSDNGLKVNINGHCQVSLTIPHCQSVST